MVVVRLPPVLVLPLLGSGFPQASPVWVLPLLGCGFEQAFPGLGLAFVGLWLCSGFPQSWSCLFWAVVMHRPPPVLILPFLGCSYAQASSGFCLAFAELWLFASFPQTWSCLFWAVVVNSLPLVFVLNLLDCGVHRLPPVLVLPMLGYVCAHVFPGLGLAFAVLLLCNFTHNKGLNPEILRVQFPWDYNVTRFSDL